MVLLRNDDVLPLTPSELRKVAVIGPNAGRAVIMGGGSASLPVPELRSPLDALRDRLGPNVEIVHEPGVDISLTTPAVPGSMLSADGEPGVAVELFAFDDLGGEVLHRDRFASGSITWFMGTTPAEVGSTFAYRASAELAVETAGLWRLSLVQTEPARLLIDGEVVLDGHGQDLPSGPDFFGMGKRELTHDLELDPTRPIRIELESTVTSSGLMVGAKLGLRRALPTDAIDRAVAAAADADAVIVVVGTDADWETEGGDRESMNLPGRQDELVARVLEVAPDAVVVLNVGAPVAVPWADRCRALLQSWFGGVEMAEALVDVLLGECRPRRPAAHDDPGPAGGQPELGELPRRERPHPLLGGRARRLPLVRVAGIDVAFPFGHGLSYSRFEIGVPDLSASTFSPGGTLQVRVPVTNVGDRTASEVVQLYVAPRRPKAFRPPKELKAFAKVTLAPGESTVVELELDDRAFARWSDADPDFVALVERVTTQAAWMKPPQGPFARGWVVDPGAHDLLIGRSSVDIAQVVTIDVAN